MIIVSNDDCNNTGENLLFSNHVQTAYFLLMKIPASAEKYPNIPPIITSRGKCAPTPTLVIARIIPIAMKKNTHKKRRINFCGIKANNNMVSVVKMVMECPEGRLL